MSALDFDIATDIKIYAGVITGGIFQLGFSVLDGPDVLGDSVTDYFTSVQIQADVVSLDTTEGASFEQGLLSKLETGTATIGLQTTEFDPYATNYLRVGTFIQVTCSGIGELFSGYLDLADMTYNVDGSMNLTLTCSDDSKKWLTKIIPDFDLVALVGHAEPYTVPEILQALLDLYPDFVYSITDPADYVARIPDISGVDVPFADVLTTIQDAEQSFMYYWNGALSVDYRGGLTPPPGYTANISIGNQHDVIGPEHICATNIDVALSTDDLPNKIVASLADGSYTVTKTNQDMIDLFGENAYDVSVNLFNDADLDAWANALSSRNQVKRVKSVQAKAISDLNSINGMATFNPGQLLEVYFVRGATNIREIYAATRVSHSIAVDGWTTTLDLWKGF